MTISRAPLYNLGAVLKETGLAADTLRAWERRYGTPMPRRTPGGHRLYSERDILLIKWLRARQAEGLTISRAVEQWNALCAAGNDPLEQRQASSGLSPAYGKLDALRDEWLAACLRYDEVTAEEILNQAYAQYSVETVTANLIERALHEAGEMWARGEASVQQEHFLSALTTRRLDALIAAAPAPEQFPVVLLACAEGEQHALPMLFLNMLLRRRGRKVVFLGANVPISQITETAQAVDASLVVLSAEQLVTAATLRDCAALLAKKRIAVAYGGRVFDTEPDLQKQVIGAYLGNDLTAAARGIEELLNGPAPKTPRLPPGSGGTQAEAFRQARARIELNVQQRFSKMPLPSRLLTLANNHFGPGLAAALDLGNVRYLENDMRWIHSVLAGQGLPAKALQEYLLAYADAIRKVMGTSSIEIVSWLRGRAAQMESGSRNLG
jgi:MerR family transcriptional regulator, light-induced transcriptional regulator